MRSVREGGWEKTLSRYFAALNIPLRWEYRSRRFTGISGFAFSRINPYKEEAIWARMPEYINKYEHLEPGKQVVVFVTTRRYGDTVDDSLVLMRMGTFTKLIKSLVDSDKERWVVKNVADD